MKMFFTQKQIDNFKREAKVMRKASGQSQSEALDCIAKREGFANWSLLMRDRGLGPIENFESPKNQFGHKSMLEVVERFIRALDSSLIFCLCWNGSIWVDRDDARDDEITVESLHALGNHRDSATRQYAGNVGAVYFTNFDGLADYFVLEDDEDYEGNPRKPGLDQVMYTTEVGRQTLLDCVRRDLESDFDSLMIGLEQDEY